MPLADPRPILMAIPPSYDSSCRDAPSCDPSSCDVPPRYAVPYCDYIFFADDRSGVPTSTMHIADQLAKTNRIFWVNIYTRLPKLSLKEIQKAAGILSHRSAMPAVNQQDTGTAILSFTPIQFPWFGMPARTLNGYFARRLFQKLVRQYNIQHPILVTNFPCAADAFCSIRQAAPHVPMFYYCVDDYIEVPGLHPKHWAAMEQDLFEIVDGSIFTSRDLLEHKKRRESLPSLYLPHGVDVEHFACKKEQKTIDVLNRIRKPLVGFFGTVDTRVDLEAIIYLAKRFTECSFVVIGRSVVPLTVMEGLANVHYLGHVSYSELPQYARYFDIGLIPYVINGLTKAINPLKLMEYYAVGIPVISSRLPDVTDRPGPLYFADSHKEFGDRLEEIIPLDKQKMRLQSQEIARQNSWAARAESFKNFTAVKYA